MSDVDQTRVELDRALFVLMDLLNQFTFQSLGNRVLSGPFKGMELPTPDKIVWKDANSSLKLLGIYERELHRSIAKAIARKPRVVVNIGCAEGYYAIGLARALPQALVYAFDIEIKSLGLMAEYAGRNDVADRIKPVLGCTEQRDLTRRTASAPTGHRLYFVDCEGFENTLLDLQLEPALAQADMIVECHDFLAEGTRLILTKRFAATHEIEAIEPVLPDLNAFPEIFHTNAMFRALALTERRPIDQSWLAMWSREGRSCR